MSDIPSFPYRDLWEERSLVSVANLTRKDGDEKKYKLIGTSPGGLRFERRIPGGTYSFDYKHQDIEQLRIEPDQPARVVIDETTGVIVFKADRPGTNEVGEERLPLRAQEHVARLEVAVHDAGPVDAIQALEQRRRDALESRPAARLRARLGDSTSLDRRWPARRSRRRRRASRWVCRSGRRDRGSRR